MKQEENRPMINMGDGNSGNVIKILGMEVQTALVIGALLLNIGVTWNRVTETDIIARELSAKVQVLETKVAQQETLIQTIVPRMEKIDGNIEKLTDSIINLSGKISK
ncbi:hypothetical protein [Aeromonas hydrophila]|uniref:hypothetical protein n=1 Tax=Aeromonas hydrophila TaxID=644 RepID=UPI000C321025|nr:hypothetical protein [Aeromonas hydrophila]